MIVPSLSSAGTWLAQARDQKGPWTALGDGALTIGRADTRAAARRSRVIARPAVAVRELRAWQLESGGLGGEPTVGDMTANALRLRAGAKRC